VDVFFLKHGVEPRLLLTFLEEIDYMAVIITYVSRLATGEERV